MLARGSHETLRTGFQIAYGFIAVIDDLKGYDEAAMTLFDYRSLLIHATHSAQEHSECLTKVLVISILQISNQ